MCGFVALFGNFENAPLAIDLALQRMSLRGPDGCGVWQDEITALGHRRLSIIDLHDRSIQPMVSSCGRYVIVFNGEIYNYRDLKIEMEKDGVIFHTSSDTEVILNLFSVIGVDLLPKLQGMFSFVIWDRLQKSAFIARDPYGIKPLYFSESEFGVMFASQVKALLATKLVSHETDPYGEAGFWMLGSVPEPHTWYRDIQAVKSGHYLIVEGGKVIKQHCWFDVGSIWRGASANYPHSIFNMEDIVRGSQIAIRESIARHVIADVPVSVFLSGGLDSSSIAGTMIDCGVKDLIGITVAYEEFKNLHHDESVAAKIIADHYGFEHHVRWVSREEFYSDIEAILDSMDQPSIDGVNTWYASKAVKELGLKVVLSGVGGDELLLGYKSFHELPHLKHTWGLVSRIPGIKSLANQLGKLQASRSGNLRWRHAPEWMLTISGAWWLRRSLHVPEVLASLVQGNLCSKIVLEFNPQLWVSQIAGELPKDDYMALSQIESMGYLRNQLLRDSDWASMGHSLELRTPFVDSHLLRSLQPYLTSFHKITKKDILGTLPSKPLPMSIINREKTGFGIPVQSWLNSQYLNKNNVQGWDSWMKKIVQYTNLH